MEYTTIEKQVLSLMERTDFKNLSKNDIISYASKLGQLRPEVAKEVLSKYPELIALMRTALSKYKDILDSIIQSDDESLRQYFDLASKEIDNASDSRKQFYTLVESVRSDYSKCLDNPDITPEMQMEILQREMELIKFAEQKDSEIRKQELEIETNAKLKDSEKRDFNWKLVGGISAALVAVVGIGAGVLGGSFNIKLPRKS